MRNRIVAVVSLLTLAAMLTVWLLLFVVPGPQVLSPRAAADASAQVLDDEGAENDDAAARDLPTPDILIEITRNARREAAALGSAEDRMAAIDQCYEQWGASPSPTQSAYCLQLDRAAYSQESVTAWATPGHFFSDWSFLMRQLDNAPPYDPALSGQVGQSRRLAAYEALADADDRVARELSSLAAPRVQADHAAEDIALPPETAREITRRAVNDANGAYRGFANWVTRANNCYETLAPEDVEQRIYCLQFDATAMALEQSAPESFRQMDLEINDFYAPQRFIERQLLHLPPQEDVPNVEQRRRGVRFVLNAAVDAAMIDWLARSEREHDAP